jgi:hypothetical protein
VRVHKTHVTRFSMDSSLFDEICINCGETDGYGGRLKNPCSKPVGQGGITLKVYGSKMLQRQEKGEKR